MIGRVIAASKKNINLFTIIECILILTDYTYDTCHLAPADLQSMIRQRSSKQVSQVRDALLIEHCEPDYGTLRLGCRFYDPMLAFR